MKLSKEDECCLWLSNPCGGWHCAYLVCSIPVPSVLFLWRWWVGRIWTIIPVVPSST